MDEEIVIKLSKENCEKLVEELNSLYGYHWNDQNIHADNCGSSVVSIIEEQINSQINK